MRSSEISSTPPSRRIFTAADACPAVWVRCIQARTSGEKDCTPSETRPMPAARHADAASGVTSSGFASSVTSAVGESRRSARKPAISEAMAEGSSRDGVPPPK
jgi:hypothetical protein